MKNFQGSSMATLQAGPGDPEEATTSGNPTVLARSASGPYANGPSTAASVEMATTPIGADGLPRHVLLAVEARARGFRNALAFRRWCRRRGVPIRADGKLRWVSPAEVDKAIARISADPAPRPNAARAACVAVADAVADLIMSNRRPRR